MNILIIILSILWFGFYVLEIKKNKLNTRLMVLIGMFTAVSYILYTVHFVRYPQGGGITLFSMMPIMILSILYGKNVGLTAGLIFGVLKLLGGATIVHPLQFILDYLLANMALGVAGSFGKSKKINIICGCLISSMLSVSFSILSGVAFFGEHAPPGMNIWLYSFIYNFTSAGVEGILTTVVVALTPINRLAKASKLSVN